MIDLINMHKAEIENTCREFSVRRLDVFGSAVRGDFCPGQSDVDLVADFSGEINLLNRYLDFSEAIEKVLGAPVDVITPRSIKNPYFKSAVEREAVCIYAA